MDEWVVRKLYAWDLHTLDFVFFMLKWTILRFQNTQEGHSLWVFFFQIKKQNGEWNVRNFRRFLFGMSPDVPEFQVRVLTSDFKF